MARLAGFTDSHSAASGLSGMASWSGEPCTSEFRRGSMTGNEDVSVAERARDRISMKTVKFKSERADAPAAIGKDAIRGFLTRM